VEPSLAPPALPTVPDPLAHWPDATRAAAAAERFGLEHGADATARETIGALVAGKLGPDQGAAQLARLFAAVSELLALDGARHVSADAAREYAAMTRKMRGALVHHVQASATAQKRARTYLEERIIRQAEACGSEPTVEALATATANVLALTAGDVWSAWLPLDAYAEELRACIRAAASLRPRGGRFVSPGGPRAFAGIREGSGGRRVPRSFGTTELEAYEKALRALCVAVGLLFVERDTRAPARSRAKKRDR
jgi:hypothetical protein